MNLDGPALYESGAVLFLAQLYGVELSLGKMIAVAFAACASSIGSASMPQSGIVMIIVVLNTLNIPPAAITYIIPIDWLLQVIFSFNFFSFFF